MGPHPVHKSFSYNCTELTGTAYHVHKSECLTFVVPEHLRGGEQFGALLGAADLQLVQVRLVEVTEQLERVEAVQQEH